MNILRSKTPKLLLVGALSATLFACGGGGGGGGTAGTTTVTRGVITNFGSVWVGDVRYHTNNASISYDDNPGLESDLNIGEMVTIHATFNDDGTATASSVTYDDELKGPIQAGSIDLATRRITVLGQVVDTSRAIFDDNGGAIQGLEDLADGNVVEISGYPSGTPGVDVDATRVELKAANADTWLAGGGKIEVKGNIDSVGASTLTINNGSLTVDWSGADTSDMPLNTADWAGLFVEAKCEGANAAACFSGATLLATKVEPEQEGLSGSADSYEIEGAITEFNGQDDFKVGRQHVNASDASFQRGSAGNLANGVRVEVYGRLVGNTLDADLVKFELEDNVRVEGTIDVNGINGNTVSVMGIPFTVTDGTEKIDNSSARERMFTISHLNDGDAVELRGHLSNGTITATRLEREDSINADRFIVEALPTAIDNIADPNFRMLGLVTVDTTLLNFGDFQDENEAGIGRAAYFDRLENDPTSYARAKARGTFSGGFLTANEVEFEIDD